MIEFISIITEDATLKPQLYQCRSIRSEWDNSDKRMIKEWAVDSIIIASWDLLKCAVAR